MEKGHNGLQIQISIADLTKFLLLLSAIVFTSGSKEKKNVLFCDVTDVSEERIASIIRVTRISQLGTLPVTSDRSTRIVFLRSVLQLLTLFLASRLSC
jgi:hypothetical protein